MTTTKWALDPTHSEIGFRVRHMMITNVSGSFQSFNVQASTNGNDFTTAKIEFTADVSSINTNNPDRDNHLKSGDFFNADKYPQLKFTSTKVEKKGDDNFVVHGNLTVKDVTKPVKLDVEFGGIGKDPWGNEKAGFTLSGKINRTEFGLNWNAALETGGVLVSEDVKLYAEIQLVKQAS
ncbi:YceI family protein [Chryseosolibacter indicus]|uniref:YceI family protein n=1 Tax=Chryseosolibacter indicus TaxID=2782351 RepID=A0ABS5VR68_9BACT|nr:YceI family protein [Chryseosolibacter indicus]